MLLKPYQHLSKARHIGILVLVVFVALGMYVASQNDHTNKQPDSPTPLMTQDTLHMANDSAITRLTHNLKSDGSFNYQYDTTSHTYATTNNDIRQLMASRLLASLADEDTTLRPLHQKNLAYIFRTLYKDHGDEASVELANKSKLGGIAMLLRTLVASPYFEQYSGQAEKLANSMLSLQQRDGSFHARYKAPTYTYDEDYLLTFYSGEGILALLEYYLKTQNPKRLDAALLSQNYYLNAYVTDIQKNYYPAYVPWHTMSLSLCYQITHEQKYADAIFLLNDKLIDEMLDTTPAFVGRFYNAQLPQYGTPHTASDGVYLEGLVYAYRLARELGDTVHIQKYTVAIMVATQNLMRLQYTQKEQPNIAGAIRISAKNPDIRIDTTQHMIDAFRALLASDFSFSATP